MIPSRQATWVAPGFRWFWGKAALGLFPPLWMSACFGQSELVRPHIPGYDSPDWEAQLRAALPKGAVWEYADVAFLIVALGAASYVAIRARSRTGLLVIAGLSLAWLGFWRQGCICPIGALQNVALTLADPSYFVPTVVVLLVVVPILFTLLCGRTFCAAVCPLGAFQELTAIAPVRIPRWVDESLGLFPYAFLGLAVMTTVCSGYFLICHYDPFVSFFRLGANASTWIFSIGVVLLGLVIARPYCRFLCPLGAIFRIVSPLSRWHLRIPPSECINCRLCEEVCPYNAIRRPEEGGWDGTSQKLPISNLHLVVACCGVVIAGVVSGLFLGPVTSRLDWRIQLAERVWLEESGQVVGTTDASDVFRKSGIPVSQLYEEAAKIEGRYRWGCLLVGLWFGGVMAAKVLQLSRSPHRREYEPERGKCYSCGRCFRFCPLEQVRLGLIDADSIRVYAKAAEKDKARPT